MGPGIFYQILANGVAHDRTVLLGSASVIYSWVVNPRWSKKSKKNLCYSALKPIDASMSLYQAILAPRKGSVRKNASKHPGSFTVLKTKIIFREKLS